MGYEVTVNEVPACTVIAKRHQVDTDAIGPAIQTTFAEVYGWISRSDRTPTGEPFVIYHERPSADSGWAIEVCAPVSGPMEVPAGYILEEMPPTTVATTTHVGPYTQLDAAYEEIERFIRSHELEIGGPPREIYLTGPEVAPNHTRTRIEFPVSRLPMVVRG
jgi:effector-binding domain-containing protein